MCTICRFSPVSVSGGTCTGAEWTAAIRMCMQLLSVNLSCVTHMLPVSTCRSPTPTATPLPHTHTTHITKQSLPELGVPELPSFLKPPKDFRSATFDVTYLDKSMRITRGDRCVDGCGWCGCAHVWSVHMCGVCLSDERREGGC